MGRRVGLRRVLRTLLLFCLFFPSRMFVVELLRCASEIFSIVISRFDGVENEMSGRKMLCEPPLSKP